MFRWSMLLTRIAILLLIAAALWIGQDVIIRMAIIDAAQSTTGAKVDIERVRTSYPDRKIFLDRIAVADPRDPMQNLFQAEAAVMKIDFDQILHRKIHIEECSTAQFVFGSPRSVSGALSKTEPANDQLAAAQEIPIQLNEPDPRQAWLDRFEFSNPIENLDQLEMTEATQNVIRNLNRGVDQQVSNIESLKQAVRQIHDDSQNFDKNVLRKEKIESAQKRLESLRCSIGDIANSLSELDRHVAENKNKIAQAKQQDELRIRNSATQRQIKGDTITQLLLNDNQLDQARSVLLWYLAFRDAIPEPTKDFQGTTSSGSNAIIPGISDTPSFLIKSMQIDGEGRLEGRKFNFTGTATNISTEPHLVNSPTTFNLRAQGNMHFVVDCVLDRRNQSTRDEISLVCPDLPVGSRMLGNPEMMQVSVSPCRSKINISLQCQDDDLTGFMNFDYDNLVMQIENLDDLAGGIEVASRINLDLASITNYSVRAKISGPVSAPEISFESDLGNQFASKFNSIVERKTQLAINQLDKVMEQYVEQLENQVSEKIRMASTSLERDIIQSETRLSANLKNLLPKDPVERNNIHR